MYPSPLPHSKKAGNYLGKGIKYRDSFGFVCDGCFGIWAPGYSIEQHILSPISILSSKWSRLPVDIKSITQIMFTSVDRGGSCASFGLPPRGDDVFLTFCYLLLFIFFSPPLPCCFFFTAPFNFFDFFMPFKSSRYVLCSIFTSTVYSYSSCDERREMKKINVINPLAHIQWFSCECEFCTVEIYRILTNCVWFLIRIKSIGFRLFPFYNDVAKILLS